MTAPPDLSARLLGFCRLLREEGCGVTPAHSLAAVGALRTIDVGDREDVRLALRAVLACGPAELEAFDQTFAVYWEGALKERREEPEVEAVAARDGSWRYSSFESLAGCDFADFVEDEDRAALETALRQLARKLAARRSRRWRPARHGRAVDPRRTMRGGLRYGGTPLELARRTRAIRKARLVLLCDVSRSMDQYSRFLLQFVYAFQRALGRVEAFVFGTRLTRVTRTFRTSSIQQAVERIAAEVPDWGGGTRIGLSLRAFNQAHRGAVDSSTTVLVLSDGLDTGNLDVLEAEMAHLRARARRVIWLNPLLGRPHHEHLAAGMQRALPYVDTFAPGHNLASLQALAKLLA